MTVWTYTLPSEFGRRSAAGCGLFVHSDLRNVGVAMSKLAAYAEALARPLPVADGASVAPLPDDLPPVLTEHQAKKVLAPYGLPRSYERLVASVTEAAEAADTLGYPVALKIVSPDLPHKTEVGGVVLGLEGRESVAAACERIMASARRYNPDARIDGLLVQKMAPKGHELVLGTVNDPTFGPVIMVGLGGTMVELTGDVVHRLAPVDATEASQMLRCLRTAKLFEGFRGSKPIDTAPLAALIANLSQAALAYRDRIAEIEFNPIILHEDGSGLTIADALITLRSNRHD